MLSRGRFSWRHDSILKYLYTHIKNNSSKDLVIFADLPNLTMNGGTVPPDILVTSKRPDMVLINYKQQLISLLELTVPFSTNILSAESRKNISYSDLGDDLKDLRYHPLDM